MDIHQGLGKERVGKAYRLESRVCWSLSSSGSASTFAIVVVVVTYII
jgi:hypothetical protein